MKQQLPEKKAEAMTSALKVSNEKNGENNPSRLKIIDDNTFVINSETSSGEEIGYKMHRNDKK